MTMNTNFNSSRLTDLQLTMMQLFSRDLSEEDTLAIRRMMVKYFAEKLDTEMERLEKENGWTAETYAAWADEHNRISPNGK